MDFSKAAKLGACLAKDHAEEMFRLLANYRDISASEAASRTDLHIKTAQDFLETVTDLGIVARAEVREGKRPYYRYSLQQEKIQLELDLTSLRRAGKQDEKVSARIRERRNAAVHFSTSRDGQQLASILVGTGQGRDRKQRKINLTAAQGKFLYHLPFPTAEPLRIDEIMRKAGLSDDSRVEVLSILELLEELRVLEVER
ncbi:MAG TPA: hypothetical protein VLE22_08450 [Bryobacteraceae bacterium]|nr:hypothetical protein [Bryobacteraceae bacterium]